MNSFRRLTISTLVAVYILILVGGIVRSTGSGMGCPDWPKCFGSWVPPTSVKDLPENYKEIYSDYRNKKNQRFAKYLTVIGMDETADGILNNPAVLHEADFNPAKTLIEYFNRILGVIIGLLIIAVAVYSWRFRKTEPRLTILAFASLALVIFQGWIGSFVVSTNLTPWTITVHMFLALALVALLIYLAHLTGSGFRVSSSLGFWWLLASMALLLVQILLGTQVREAIDQIAATTSRENWIAGIFETFSLHRSFSWIVLLVHVGLIVRLRQTQGLKIFPLTLILLILSTILTGAGMAYFGVPPFLQPIHLLLASITFGLQFLLLLKLNRKEDFQVSTS
jgi:cytochrome c oxidase assembly protein subunit 15